MLVKDIDISTRKYILVKLNGSQLNRAGVHVPDITFLQTSREGF